MKSSESGLFGNLRSCVLYPITQRLPSKWLRSVLCYAILCYSMLCHGDSGTLPGAMARYCPGSRVTWWACPSGRGVTWSDRRGHVVVDRCQSADRVAGVSGGRRQSMGPARRSPPPPADAHNRHTLQTPGATPLPSPGPTPVFSPNPTDRSHRAKVIGWHAVPSRAIGNPCLCK